MAYLRTSANEQIPSSPTAPIEQLSIPTFLKTANQGRSRANRYDATLSSIDFSSFQNNTTDF